MLGTSRPPPLPAMPDAASRFGPRGCDPLAWSPRARISRGAGDWADPTVASFAITATPILVARPNIHRANLWFGGTFTLPTGAPGGIALAVSQAQAAAGCFALCLCDSWTDAGSPPPITFCGCLRVRFGADGNLSQIGWWAVLLGGALSATLCVTSQEYYG